MGFIDIDSDIQRIKQIVDRWQQTEVSELERELVLEKLRSMYEKVLSFEKKQPVAPKTSGLGKSAIMSLYGVSNAETSGENFSCNTQNIEPQTERKSVFSSYEESVNEPELEAEVEAKIEEDIDVVFASMCDSEPQDAPDSDVSESDNTPKYGSVGGEVDLFAQIDNYTEESAVVQTTLNLSDPTPIETPLATPIMVTTPTTPKPKATSSIASTIIPSSTQPLQPVSTSSGVSTPVAAKKVLGEVAQEGASGVLNDVIGKKNSKMDLTTKIQNKKITDLRQGIGLNDRFLLIKDIFGGDPVLYDKTIEELNKFEDFDQAMIYIYENYSGDPDSPAVKLLVDLLSYKLS